MPFISVRRRVRLAAGAVVEERVGGVERARFFDGRGHAETFGERRATTARFVVLDRDGHGARRAHDADELLAARDRGVEQVALEHHEVRLHQRQDHDRVLAALRLVDGGGEGVDELVQIREVVGDLPSVEIHRELAALSASMPAMKPRSPLKTSRS